MLKCQVGGACSSDDDTYMERQGVDELAGPEGEGQATTSNLESKVGTVRKFENMHMAAITFTFTLTDLSPLT